jgi:choline dehydrogenase-like flavoprotein
MARQTFDVVVVGSGPGGGIATYVLAMAGLKVALVEAGRRMRPGVDYNAHGDLYANLEKRLAAGFRSPVSRVTDYQEKDHFVPVGDNPRHGLLKALGGRSLCWAGHSLRFGPLDFKRWPISYDAMAPYYAKAERFMAVYGNRDGLSNLPDGEFLKGVPLRCGEQMLARGVHRLRKQGRAMAFVAQRKAMPTEAHASRRAVCHYCGHCMAGCEVDSKYTSANTPIPAAMRTGNLTMFLESTMTRILMSKDGRKAAGIEYVNAKGETGEVRGKAVVLACSAVETARHLLWNKTREFPNGLANSSGQVGRNLTSHFGVYVKGLFPQLRGRDHSNDDGTDFYHSLLTGLYWDQPSKKFEGTYQVQCGAGLHPRALRIRDIPGYGASLKQKLVDWNSWHAEMNLQGMLLQSPRKFVDLDPEKRDKFGLALPRVHLRYDDNDIAMAQDAIETCEEIIRTAGGEVIQTPGRATADKLIIDSNHWVGTTRMGTNPKDSVVDATGRAHDIPNLCVGDASVFPAYPEKNPTLTNIALSWRMSDHLVERFRKGEVA